MKRFADKVVLVTGSSSGIGLGIARRFGEEGAKVVLNDRDDARGLEALERLEAVGCEVSFVRADVANEPDAQHLIDSVTDTHGRLDVLVNNAGCGLIHSPVGDETTAAERWAFYRGVNLDAAFYTTSQALPWLAQQSGSAVINISSTATLHGNWGLYGAAKAGVEGLTRSFAAEAAGAGIRVNAVSPGWIDTVGDGDAARVAGTAPPALLTRLGTPADIASVVAFLASSDAAYITGQVIVVDGGMTVTDYPSRELLADIGKRGFSAPGAEDDD